MSRSWVDIDLDAVGANVKALRALAPNSELCAVIKAGGYGHGAVEVAGAALAAGATRLGVAQAAEGTALRQAGIAAPIWVLSELDPDEYPDAARAGLEPAVYTAAAIDQAAQVRGMRVHLKIDTGMHRVGAAPIDAVALAQRIDAAPTVTLGSVWTHLACADDDSVRDSTGRPVTEVQLERYDKVLADLVAAGVAVPLRHGANSAGTIAHPAAHYDVVRCGIALYGLAPSPSLEGAVALRPALSWHTRVAHVKRLAAGAAVSYGHRGAVSGDTTVATIPVGYADGYRRRLWNTGGQVLIGGRRRPIVGAVTMDQIVVECGDDEVAVGDDVVLIGRQGDEEIRADELADRLDTINYEITCGIGNRVERRYRRG